MENEEKKMRLLLRIAALILYFYCVSWHYSCITCETRTPEESIPNSNMFGNYVCAAVICTFPSLCATQLVSKYALLQHKKLSETKYGVNNDS